MGIGIKRRKNRNRNQLNRKLFGCKLAFIYEFWKDIFGGHIFAVNVNIHEKCKSYI